MWYLMIAGMIAAGLAVADERPLVLPPTAPPVQAWDALIAPGMAGGSIAPRLVLHNPTSETVVIVGASSPLARNVVLQHYQLREGVTQLYPLPRVEVPAGHELAFVPFGLELRLLDLVSDVTYGMDVPLTLRFANGTTRTLRLTIEQPSNDDVRREDPNPDFQ